MATTAPMAKLYVDGVQLMPEQMTPDCKNFAMVLGRIHLKLMRQYERGEIDVNTITKTTNSKKNGR